jgi:hypothetical protein
MSTGRRLTGDILPLLAPSSKVFSIPRFGEYSSSIIIHADPHNFRGDPSTLKKY